MNTIDNTLHINESVASIMRKDFTVFNENLTIDEALQIIRNVGLGERIIYFYISDENNVLKGIIPTRRLLSSLPGAKLKDIMISRIIYLPESAKVYDALEFFVLYKFLAIPIVDSDKKLIGIIDVTEFTEDIMNIPENEKVDDLFETIGFKYNQIKNAHPLRAFRYRFPWLLTTLASGFIGALLVNYYEVAISHSIIIAFFLALILGLAESISIQSMTITIQALRFTNVNLKWYSKEVIKELITSSMIGIGLGTTVFILIIIFYNAVFPALIISISILLSNISSCIVGLSVPSLLHYFKLDPKIASGPATLAMTDIVTLIIYFNTAIILL